MIFQQEPAKLCQNESATTSSARFISTSDADKPPQKCIKPGQDFSRTSRQKTCPMGRAVSEDCQPASALLLHPVNPLPSITRSVRLNKQRSGDLSLLPPRISEIPRFCQRRKSLHLLSKFSPPEATRLQQSMPLLSPQGKNDRLRYRSAEWTVILRGPLD